MSKPHLEVEASRGIKKMNQHSTRIAPERSQLIGDDSESSDNDSINYINSDIVREYDRRQSQRSSTRSSVFFFSFFFFLFFSFPD